MLEKLNLRPSERRLLVGIGVVVFVVVNIWFVWPHFSDLARVREERAEADKKMAKFQEEISKKTAYQRKVIELQKEGTNPTDSDKAVGLIRAIQNEAAKRGVSASIQRQNNRTNQFFVDLSQTISTVSGEEELVNFLYHLGSEGSIRVRDLTLRTDGQRRKLNGTITLVASYPKETQRHSRGEAKPSTTKDE